MHLVGTYNNTSNTTNWEALVHGVVEIENTVLSVIYDTKTNEFYGMIATIIIFAFRYLSSTTLGNLTYGGPSAPLYAALQVIYQPQDCNENKSSPTFYGSGQLALTSDSSSITVAALVNYDKCNSKWSISAVEDSKSWELAGLELDYLRIALTIAKVYYLVTSIQLISPIFFIIYRIAPTELRC